MKNAQNYNEDSRKFNIEVKGLPSAVPSYLVSLQDLNGNNLSASIHETFDDAIKHMKDLENTHEGYILEKRINVNL
jgi:hypothetical protein